MQLLEDFWAYYFEWPVQCQTYSYLPSCKAPPPIGWYQVILLGDRGTLVLTTCPGLHSTARPERKINRQMANPGSPRKWPLKQHVVSGRFLWISVQLQVKYMGVLRTFFLYIGIQTLVIKRSTLAFRHFNITNSYSELLYKE